MNFIAAAQMIFSLLPTLIGAVNTVEGLFPQAGSGAQKLAMVKTMLEAANAHSGDIADFEAYWPVISKTISGLVATFKAIV